MRFNSGIQGSTGTVRVASGATFQHDAASVVGNLITAGTLALADRTITVHSDYNNANFGVGDAFNRRANVTTSGAGNRIIAAGDANQGLSGAGVTNGNTTAATLTIGNVRVGSNTFTYNINNELKRIKARTLVVHVQNDQWLMVENARKAAAAVPDALFATLSDPGAHYGVFRAPNILSDTIGAFIENRFTAKLPGLGGGDGEGGGAPGKPAGLAK